MVSLQSRIQIQEIPNLRDLVSESVTATQAYLDNFRAFLNVSKHAFELDLVCGKLSTEPMSAELERHKPYLHNAEELSDAENIPQLFDALLNALGDSHMRDGELHQLWLEASWLQSDFERKVLAKPNNWELLMFKIARGEVSANFKRYPEIIHRTKALANALDRFLKKAPRMRRVAELKSASVLY